MPPLSSVAPAKDIPNSRSEFRSGQEPRPVSGFCGISRKQRPAERTPAGKVMDFTYRSKISNIPTNRILIMCQKGYRGCDIHLAGRVGA